ncbi:uncharacterized protein [Gossypium hirsutum]|uniref:DNA/RNA polymerases superfamily protein n=1 Tax=Gossypium hirsutum TaxID=3635 RepID=A0A1U8KT23_GOSHI|nr:uncharacterized protein LOC107919133 [Gossypium hirsutum]
MTDLRAMFARLSLFDDGILLAKFQVENDSTFDFRLNSDGVLCFHGWVCVSNDSDLRQSILRKVHSSPYTIHLGGNKMYWDLRELYWWPGLKREVLGFKLVSKTKDKVRLIPDHLKAASDRQKSYADLKMRDIEYYVGGYVFLNVSPWKKVLRFRHKEKLSPKFIGPYQILKRVGPIAYQLELPLELDRIHVVFYVSMLRQYWSNPSHIVSVKEIEVRLDLTFEEKLVWILDRDVKLLRRKSIPLVKVLWQNHGTDKATWESKDSVR